MVESRSSVFDGGRPIVVVDAVQRGAGKASGIEMESPSCVMLSRCRDGKIVGSSLPRTTHEALEAAGLSE